MNTFSDAILIAFGGASGALLRAAVDGAAVRLGLAAPIGTFAVNVSGSFLAGLVAALLIERLLLPDAARPLLLVGLLGGFTTFSAFALQLARMGEGGEILSLATYAVGTLLLGVLAAAAGVALARAF